MTRATMDALRIACSNIAWNDGEEAAALACLRRHGIGAIEFAPTRAWPGWQGATPQGARDLAARHRDLGFDIVSMQALLFACPRAQLFGDDGGRAFEAHLGSVADLGAALGARVAVLGAPRNRLRGALSPEQAWSRAEPVLRRLAQRYHDAGLVLALEPARPEYGGDFLCTTRAVIDAVRVVGHPGLGVQLDAAAMHSAGEPLQALWAETGGSGLAHYQLSEPGLGGFESAVAPHEHNLRVLREMGYRGWCSIEMARQPVGLERAGPWAILGRAAS